MIPRVVLRILRAAAFGVAAAFALVPLAVGAAGAQVRTSRPPFHIPADWVRFRPAIDRFDTLESRGRRAEAWAYLDSLVAAQRTRGNRRWLVQALVKRGGTRAFRGDYRGGEPDLAEAQRTARAVGDTLGEILSLQYMAYATNAAGRLSVARPMYDRMLSLSIARRDLSHQAWARMGLAYIDLRSGATRRASIGYRNVVRLAQACGDTPALLEGRIGLANVLNVLGDYDASVAEYRRLIAEATAANFKQTVANALLNLAQVEQIRGDPQIAARLREQAEQTYLSIGDRPGARGAAKQRVDALLQLGRADAAAEILVPLIAEARTRGALEDWADTRMSLSVVRRYEGRFDEAERILRDALVVGDSLSPRSRQFLRAELASQFLVRRRWADALACAESLRAMPGFPITSSLRSRTASIAVLALAALDRPREAREWLRSTSAAGDGAPQEDSRSDLAEAIVWRAEGRLDSALVALRRVLVQWRERRAISGDLEWRESYRGRAGTFVGELIATLVAEPSVPAGAPRATRAFETLQSAKSLTLSERMERRALALRSPEGEAPLTLRRVQRALAPGEILLDYHVGSGASVVFLVTSREIRMRELPGYGDLATTLQRAAGLFERPGADTTSVRADAEALAALACPGFGDVLAGARRVVVSPDGPLHDLPFSLLPASPGGPPLLALAEVARVPSAAVFVQLRARALVTAPRGLLAFAGARNARGQRLPGALQEVRWLASRYAGTDARSSSDVKRPADLARDLARYQVLHLAGHASRDDQQPWRSGLLVGDGAGGDDWLRAAEISRLRLPARLAVLSACRSAGVWSHPEGQLGLTTAFLSAGVPAVIATQWPVRDEAAEAFTREFYPGLARGLTASAALRQAQLALRSRPGTASVSDWGAFVLVGEPGVRVTLRPVGVSGPITPRP